MQDRISDIRLSCYNGSRKYGYHACPELEYPTFMVARMPDIRLSCNTGCRISIYYDGTDVGYPDFMLGRISYIRPRTIPIAASLQVAYTHMHA